MTRRRTDPVDMPLTSNYENTPEERAAAARLVRRLGLGDGVAVDRVLAVLGLDS